MPGQALQFPEIDFHKLSLMLTICVLLLTGAGSALAGGDARPPGMASAELQGNYLILGFDDMTTRVYDLSSCGEMPEKHKGPDSEMILSVMILDEGLGLFQVLAGQWQLWDLRDDRLITELPAMPVVGGLKNVYRISKTRVALTYYRRNCPMTVVDLITGKRREISPPAGRWYVDHVKGPIFVSLAKRKLRLLDIDSGQKTTAEIECRRFALAGDDRVAVINPVGQGRVRLALIRLQGMTLIERRDVGLEIDDFDTNFHMGANDSGDVLHITSKNSVSFFKLPLLKKIYQIPGINFAFAGRRGLIAHDSDECMTGTKNKGRCFCIQSIYEDSPRCCLPYRPNVSGQSGRFRIEAGMVWAHNGKRLRMWDLASGRLVNDYELPRCQRSLNAKSGSLALPRDSAGLWVQAVDNSGHAWAACAGDQSVKLYRLGENAPKKILDQAVPSSFAVFLLKKRKALAPMDMQGRIRVCPLGS